ncbi:MAG: hypothetical protein QOE01_1070 [Actinomycetota bacterium]|jgi:hypothetical protein|nr:hypothetical protein [Actinomycetota bacterium]
MPLRYEHVLIAMLVDLLAVTIVAYGVFYRRYRRSDLLLAYVAVNIGLFVTGVLIVQQMHIGVAFGFGLFAVLSIIRLRSDPIAPEESAYYFIALVLGLVNGMQYRDRWLILTLDVAIVSVMVLLDNRWVMPRSQRQLVTLDVVHPDQVSLRADLERRLGGKVSRMIVRQVDYVRDVTIVDVRFVVPHGKKPAPAPPVHSSRPFDQLGLADLETP